MRPPRHGGPSDKTLPTPDPAQVQLIRSYGPGRFLIGEREWRSPVLVARTLAVPWEVARAEDLALANLAPLRAADPPVELLVVGCGPRTVFLPPPLRAEIKAAGWALEVVDTGSACRIFNVLLAEERRVAAALVPV
ncbi:MAG: Mth938-like domain-containing protein [Pseudomonadota bacterium]